MKGHSLKFRCFHGYVQFWQGYLLIDGVHGTASTITVCGAFYHQSLQLPHGVHGTASTITVCGAFYHQSLSLPHGVHSTASTITVCDAFYHQSLSLPHGVHSTASTITVCGAFYHQSLSLTFIIKYFLGSLYVLHQTHCNLFLPTFGFGLQPMVYCIKLAWYIAIYLYGILH